VLLRKVLNQLDLRRSGNREERQVNPEKPGNDQTQQNKNAERKKDGFN